MARNLIEQAITANDIEEYLVNQDDFNLEVRCFHECLAHRLMASHGGSYDDPVTNKPRQYDVRASASHNRFKVHMAIEVKNLKPNYPLVVSRVSRRPSEAYHDLVVSVDPNGEFLRKDSSFEAAAPIRIPSSFYRPRDFVGKATAQIGRNTNREFVAGDGEVYDKWSQAVSSAHDLIQEAGLREEDHQPVQFFSLILPVLVVANGALWVVDYASDGTAKSSPQEVAECTLFLGKEWPCGVMDETYRLSHLHIFTFAGFQKLLAVLADRDFWDDNFSMDTIKQAIGDRQ